MTGSILPYHFSLLSTNAKSLGFLAVNGDTFERSSVSHSTPQLIAAVQSA